MPSRKEFGLRPSWRLIITPNNQKSPTGRWPTKKMLIYIERSRYVYENKQKDDKMPRKQSDIYG